MFLRLSALALCWLLMAPLAAAQSPAQWSPAIPPHPVSTQPAADPALLAKLELLNQRIAARDQLQREIDQLIVETQTPQQMVVHLELLEINVTASGKYETEAGKQTKWTLAEIEELRKRGIAKSLAAPRLSAANGQLITSQIGDASADGSRGTPPRVTDVQVRGDSLGNNQVRLAVHVDHSEPFEGTVAKGGDPQQPHRSTVDTRLELSFGETQLFGGLLTRKTRTRRGALGRVTEDVLTEKIIVVRVEPILPTTPGIVPATAILPR